MRSYSCLGMVSVSALLLVAGCAKQPGQQGGAAPSSAAVQTPQTTQDEAATIQEARASLSAEDRRLVEAQEFCPIMTTSRLGSMGTPLKILINEQPVFLCCKGCQRKALANPEKTLAMVAELKAKQKAP